MEKNMMTIAVRDLAEITVIDLSGRMIGNASNEFLVTASAVIVEGGTRKMIVNMKALEQCDSMGISALLRLHGSLQNMEGKLILCNLNELVTKVFALTHINEVMNIVAVEDDALEALGVTRVIHGA
jgi:anti-anti-sigma factor